MDMIDRIRRVHNRKKKSEPEIARITGLSRNTISKWLHGAVDGPPKYQRGEQPGKVSMNDCDWPVAAPKLLHATIAHLQSSMRAMRRGHRVGARPRASGSLSPASGDQ